MSISTGKLLNELWTILWCWPKLNLVSDIIRAYCRFGWKMLKSKPNFISLLFCMLFVLVLRMLYNFKTLGNSMFNQWCQNICAYYFCLKKMY